MPDDRGDSALLERCLSGNDEADWDQFVRRYSRLIWSSIHKTFRASAFSHQPEDVEDIFGALFLSLVEDDFRKLRLFQSRNACSLSTWLAVVTVHATIDFMRRQRTCPHAASLHDDPVFAETIPDSLPNVEQLLMQAQKHESVVRSISELSGHDREVYELLYVQGVSPDAAARAMGVTTAAVYTRKHRLIERIKKSLDGL